MGCSRVNIYVFSVTVQVLKIMKLKPLDVSVQNYKDIEPTAV
jgi:hypothetical protein